MSVEVLKPAFPRDAALHQPHRDRPPLRLLIGERAHVVSDIAGDGSVVVEFDGEAEPSQVVPSTLVVALEGYEVAMPALWEVASHEADRAKLWLRLADANPPSHRERITAVFRAILSGGLTSSTGILELDDRLQVIDEPEETAEEPSLTRRTRRRAALRRRSGAVLFLLLAAGLLAFVGYNVVDRALTVQADGTVINPAAVLANAPVAGELVSYPAAVGARVKPGDTLALVKTAAGLANVASPCDCVVGGQLAAIRTTLRASDPLVQLVPSGGANKAVVSVPLDSLRRIRVGDRVTARFYDTNAKAAGTVERVSPPKVIAGSPAQSAAPNGTVEVRFARNLPAWRVGEPVIARIVLSGIDPFD